MAKKLIRTNDEAIDCLRKNKQTNKWMSNVAGIRRYGN